MSKRRNYVKLGSLALLACSLALFQNFTPTGPGPGEYVEGSGIPMSDIIFDTFQQLGNKKAPLSVVIEENEIAYLDKSFEVDELTINGELHCDGLMAENLVEIKARVIYVNGLFQCGTQSKPYTKNLVISLKSGVANPRTSLGHRSLLINRGGTISFTGDRRRSQWFRLSKPARPGDQAIWLDQSIQNGQNFWRPGDEIVIGPTSYEPTEAETFIVTSVQGNMITLNSPVQKFHSGVVESYNSKFSGNRQLDLRAEVANLKRNILIRSDESSSRISDSSATDAELGGHVMVMPGGKAFIDSVEFYRMGQAGIMARYPFHWHLVGDAPTQYIRNSSIHRSFQRCITVHRTNKVKVLNNTCFDFKGHGFFLEDGVEVGNLLEGNLGILAKFPHVNKVLLASDHPVLNDGQGRNPNVSVYWISNPQNIIRNNVASGSIGSGFWMAFENEIRNSRGEVIARPIRENTAGFEGNIAHTAKVGFTWDGAPGHESANNPNNPNDRRLTSVYYRPAITPVFYDLTAYRNKLTGFYFRGYTAVFEGNISADNGWHYWLAYHQIVRNSVIVGRSKNFTISDQIQALSQLRGDRIMQVGVIQYDGPFELNRVDFMNYPQTKLIHNYTEVTPIPIGTTGGTERLTNEARQVSFSPNPIYRAYTPPSEIGITGNTSLRDADGTFTGAGRESVLVGRDSLGVLPAHQCLDGGNQFVAHKICPGNYQESQLHMFDGLVNNAPNPNLWNMPYLVRRDDGVLSVPMNQWNQVIHPIPVYRRGGNKFTLANSSTTMYQLMFSNLKNPRLWLISESLQSQIPVTEVVAQGRNCRMTGISAVQSLEELKSSSFSAYYSNANKFYFRLLPKNLYEFIEPNNKQSLVRRYISESVELFCEDNVLPAVKGYVDSVIADQTNGTLRIRGWACYFSKEQQLNVKLYLKDPVSNTLTPIRTALASLSSEAAVAFECGVASAIGFRYELSLSGSESMKNQGKKIVVTGISPQGEETHLLQTGQFVVPTFPNTPIPVSLKSNNVVQVNVQAPVTTSSNVAVPVTVTVVPQGTIVGTQKQQVPVALTPPVTAVAPIKIDAVNAVEVQVPAKALKTTPVAR